LKGTYMNFIRNVILVIGVADLVESQSWRDVITSIVSTAIILLVVQITIIIMRRYNKKEGCDVFEI